MMHATLPRQVLILVATLGCAATLSACSTQTTESQPGAASAAVTASVTAPALLADLQRAAREAWLAIERAPHACDTFDYFPHGGLRTLYCRARNFIDAPQLFDLSPVPVFVSGPHHGELKLDATKNFGHYNPDFVATLASWAIPSPEDTLFIDLTTPTYDRVVMPLAAIYRATYLKLQQNPDYLAAEAKRLTRAMQSPGGVSPDHYEAYFYFFNPHFIANPTGDHTYFSERGFDGGYFDGNVVKSAVGFWIRRHIDGTDALFYANLQKLIDLYEPPIIHDEHTYH
ncbi:hypothetical protein FRC98_17205 [Lujinxingia vulgaris]|uniref:Uncharacterized protein n=1 Tax=Lujinxingia vulgaris TaxID=2600176 RepID=A0A5C6XCU0_9DELT|nr:hypothetical protein [Lujinxingia vulgaris]TXD35203.1 hypothetical protein FRC98_17205 [Lujinxingia vulgaris]